MVIPIRLFTSKRKLTNIFILIGLLVLSIVLATACTSGPINPGPQTSENPSGLLPKPDPLLPKQDGGKHGYEKNGRHTFQAYITMNNQDRLIFNEVKVIESHKKADIELYHIDHNLFELGVYILDLDETWLPFSITSDTEIYLKFYGGLFASATDHHLVTIDQLMDEIRYVPADQYNELLVEMTFEDGNLTEIRQVDLQQLWVNSLAYNDKVQAAFAGIDNNGSQFVKYHDKLYYLKYRPQSFEQTSLWGNRHLTDDVLAYMTVIDENGEERELFPVNSASDFYLVDSGLYDGPFIYMTMREPLGNHDYEDGDYEGHHPDIQGESGLGDSSDLVYLLSDTGEVGMEFEGHSIVDLDPTRRLLITHNYFSDEILFQDMRNARKMGSLIGVPLHYDINSGLVYYHNLDFADLEGIEDSFSIWIANPVTNFKELLFLINPEDLREAGIIKDTLAGISATNIIPAGDYVWLTLYIADGYGPDTHDQEIVLKLELDPVDPANNFVVLHEAHDIYYHGLDQAFYHSFSDFYHKDGYSSYDYYSRDYLLGPTGLLYLDNMQALGYDSFFDYGDHAFHHVEEVYVVDGHVYFTLVSGPVNEEESLGWRSAYDRTLTEVYHYDPSTNQHQLLYSY